VCAFRKTLASRNGWGGGESGIELRVTFRGSTNPMYFYEKESPTRKARRAEGRRKNHQSFLVPNEKIFLYGKRSPTFAGRRVRREGGEMVSACRAEADGENSKDAPGSASNLFRSLGGDGGKIRWKVVVFSPKREDLFWGEGTHYLPP